VEELVKRVSEKAGINAEQAQKAVTSVLDFIKEKVPGIGGQIESLMQGNVSGAVGDIGGKIGGMFKG
jgi:hypothetical protein